jgi:hypothetical protein
VTENATPRINPFAIDLLARVYGSHRRGLPEWMKNSREAYLRRGAGTEERLVILHYATPSRAHGGGGEAPGSPQASSPTSPMADAWLECIDFAGISGDDIERHYLEWANPDAAGRGLGVGEAEGGQGNGGKAYLRQLFGRGFFASLCDGRLSVVSFVDPARYLLDFVPDRGRGKDHDGDNPGWGSPRAYGAMWCRRLGLLESHNVTIVRGMAPRKPIEPEALLAGIAQSAQARETIRTCRVLFYANHLLRRELAVVPPALHPELPRPLVIPVPALLPVWGREVSTQRPPELPAGELVLSVAARPLCGQALGSWNRIEFRGSGVSVIGHKPVEELPLRLGQYGAHLFGTCRLPMLQDPHDTYELQGRVRLNDGPLSAALYAFIASEADKLLERLAGRLASAGAVKRRQNLARLHAHLTRWLAGKLASFCGLAEQGADEGLGRAAAAEPGSAPAVAAATAATPRPPASLRIHRESLAICQGVSYQLRALAEDEDGAATAPGRLTWESRHPAVVAIHPQTGMLKAYAPGTSTVTARHQSGLTSPPLTIHVHQALAIAIETPAPLELGSGRRQALTVAVNTAAGRLLREVVVSWRSSDRQVASVAQDGVVVGGELGEAEVLAYAGAVESEALDVVVDRGRGGRPAPPGKGQPLILLSGVHPCPLSGQEVILDPTLPPIYQRPASGDREHNVFWINLQLPLAEALLAQGERSPQWRCYHFERMVDVFTRLRLCRAFGDSGDLDVDAVLAEADLVASEIYGSARSELLEMLSDEMLAP